MALIKSPADYSFVNNPIGFEFSTDTNAMVNITVSSGTSLFYLSAYPAKITEALYKFSFDISDLLRNLVRLDYDATQLYQVALAGFVQEYTVTVDTYTFTGKIIPGGLSKEFQLHLARQATNAFAYRFLNPLANFLFTTRTDGDYIRLTRRELGCVFFMTPAIETVSILTDLGDRLTIPTLAIGVPCMVNLPAFIESVTASGTPKELIFCVDEIQIFKIVISEPVSEESYLIKFRNSLGVYEFLEVTGKATETPEFDSEGSYNAYHAGLQDFRKNRLRLSMDEIRNVDSGYKSTEDILFISDLLRSDSMYFIDKLSKRRCLVTSDSFTHYVRQTVPESIPLKIEFIDSDTHYSPISTINSTSYILASETGEYIVTENNQLIGV